MRTRAADSALSLLDFTVNNSTYSEVLLTVSQGIKIAVRSAKQAEVEEGFLDYAEAVADAEGQIVEDLLGVAFVICQTQINAVTHAAIRVSKEANREVIPFSAFGQCPEDIRQLGDTFDSRYSKIELLWALGNYFKHRGAWIPKTWSKPGPNEKHTIPVLKAAGLDTGSNGNLRIGAEALGNDSHEKLSVFEGIVQSWPDKILMDSKKGFGL